MITTVTTTATTGAGIELIAIMAVLLLLVTKEYTATSTHPAMQRASRLLTVGVAPLLLAVVMIVAVRLVGFFG